MSEFSIPDTSRENDPAAGGPAPVPASRLDAFVPEQMWPTGTFDPVARASAAALAGTAPTASPQTSARRDAQRRDRRRGNISFWALVVAALVYANVAERHIHLVVGLALSVGAVALGAWIVVRAVGRSRRGVRVSAMIRLPRVQRTRALISIGGPAQPGLLTSSYATYDYAGVHYENLMVSGGMPPANQNATVVIDPNHPDYPFFEDSPWREYVLWPIVLGGLAAVYATSAIVTFVHG